MQGDLLKARDLKPLSDAQLLVLGARFALRVAPWCPLGGEKAWDKGMADLIAACGGAALSGTLVRKHVQVISKHGALGSYSSAPEPMWRSRSQAGWALSYALQATQLSARKDRWKEVVKAGKHAASVFAVQAHAGRLPLADALSFPWAAARADVPLIVGSVMPATLVDLEAIGPLWPGGEPEWATP
jgi:hypothetical protein